MKLPLYCGPKELQIHFHVFVLECVYCTGGGAGSTATLPAGLRGLQNIAGNYQNGGAIGGLAAGKSPHGPSSDGTITHLSQGVTNITKRIKPESARFLGVKNPRLSKSVRKTLRHKLSECRIFDFHRSRDDSLFILFHLFFFFSLFPYDF